MKKIKIGQIGIGHNHGQGKMLAVRKFPEMFEVVGYSESDEKHIKERSGYECYKGLQRMIEEELLKKCDAILVECDVWNLTKTAQKCIDAGVHIHVDKPASGTLSEFEALLKSAKEKNLTLQMGYMYRYNFAIQKLMQMIKDGEIGEIYQIDAEMSTFHSNEYRRWLKRFKGGSMYIFGSHLVDLIVRILGEPQKVTPFIKQTGFEGVYSDDNGFAVLEYEKATAKISTLSVEPNGWGMRRFAVMGSGASVEIKPIELDVKMIKSKINARENNYSVCQEEIEIKDVPNLSRYDEMMRDFYLSVIGEKENPYSYDYEYIVQKTLCRIVGEN